MSPTVASPDVTERARMIDLLVMDVDGVLTDGSIIITDNGQELKQFYVRDGAAVAYWHRVGKKSAILSGRRSEAVYHRATELGVRHVVQGRLDKGRAVEELALTMGVPLARTCFIGDDLPDLNALKKVGLAVAVADAVPEVRQAAHMVTRSPGGRGAVRELVEFLMRTQGLWEEVMAIYG